MSVRAIPFEGIDIETSFLVWWYILTISRSSLSIKVISWKMLILLPGHQFNFGLICPRSRSYLGHLVKVKVI